MKFFKLFKKSNTLRWLSLFIILGAVFFITNGFIYRSQYAKYSYEYDKARALVHYDEILHTYEDYIMMIDNYFVEFSDGVNQASFSVYMSNMLLEDNTVESILISPNGVIEFVYPENNQIIGQNFLMGKEIIALTQIEEAVQNDITYFDYNDTLDEIVMIHPIYINGSFYGYIDLNVSRINLIAQYAEFEGTHYNAVLYDEHMPNNITQNSNYIIDEKLALDFPGLHLEIVFFHDINTYNNANLYLLFYTMIGFVFFGVLLSFVYFVVKSKEHLKEQVHSFEEYDQYSKLPNSKKLFQYIDHLIKKRQVFYLAFGNLNNMKQINEKFGHNIGNELLLKIIELIHEVITSNTSIFHYGGDEYCVVIESDSKIEVKNILNRIDNIFETDIIVQSARANFSITFGVVNYPEHGTTTESLLQNATLVIKDPRIANKNVVVFYEKQHLFLDKVDNNFEKIVNKMDLELLEVYLMPIVETQTNHITGFECLTRAFDDNGKPMDTEQLVHVLERNGRIQELDEIVFKKMLKIMKRIIAQYENEIYLSLNASALSLNEEYVDNVIRYYKEANLSKGIIVLELTESYKVDDFDYLIRLFKRLNRAGIKIAIDDFGSGYSSLSYITRFPIYAIKIDKEYVRDFKNNEFNQTLIFTLTSIAEV
ncbi:MAG: EAL domain-containing protein, partial [Bacilli bacterium]|nr:EAL domain-containing protein [Bacilli bacterium]